MPETVAIAANPLSLRSFVHEQATVIRCSGELNASTCALLKTCAKAALPDTKRLILDFAALERIDSSGLGTVVGLYISAKHAARELEIVNLTPRVRELFGLTNLLGVFEKCGQCGTRMP
ncbi:MAG TPA: STAS domain-containing protein [Candidatus Acidoferrum sp.]|nr:STAS domain-containing protein [Candidatus Acidoferrum sp.]